MRRFEVKDYENIWLIEDGEFIRYNDIRSILTICHEIVNKKSIDASIIGLLKDELSFLENREY